MNETQKKVIEDLRRDILENDGLGKKHMDGYEYKAFEVKEEMLEFRTRAPIPWVSLMTEVGAKNDEGTLAAVFCRTRRLIVVGRKGGVKSLFGTDKHGHKPVGYRNVLIYGKDLGFDYKRCRRSKVKAETQEAGKE